MSFFAEFKRRNVARAAMAYGALSWLLMQVAEVTFPAFGLDERIVRIFIVVLVIGFVPAIAFAWVFEITPEGVKRERDLDRSGPLVQRTNRMLDRAIVLLLALGVTYFAVDKFLLDPARDAARVAAALERGRSEALEASLGARSIVVLPFNSLSSDPEQEFFADGMAEDLLNLLAKIPDLRVISRTSAFSFKGKDVGIAEIAGKLRVTHALEGSVRRVDDRLRVTVQLVDARTDSPLWSETYDRTLDDIFDIQDEITAEVIAQLRLELLGPAPTAKRVDRRVHLLLMQARQLLDADTEYQRVRDLLDQAIAIEPGYAEIWTMLSWLQYRCSRLEFREHQDYCEKLPIDAARRAAKEAVDRALSIEPDNATAIAFRAWALAFDEYDWATAAHEFARAIRLGPDRTDVLRSSMVFSRFIGRPDVAIRLGEHVVARDPLCTMCVYLLARSYREAGQLAAAESTMRNFAAATGRGGWHTIATIRLLEGDAEGALEALQNLQPTDPSMLHGRALALHVLGRHQEAAAARAELEQVAATEHPQLVAEVFAWSGDLDRAYQWSLQAAEQAETRVKLAFDWTSPFLRPVLQTPRGQALLRRFNAADEQMAAITFDVTLPGEVPSD